MELSDNTHEDYLSDLGDKEELPREIRDYTRLLVVTCMAEKNILVEVIARASEHWSLGLGMLELLVDNDLHLI